MNRSQIENSVKQREWVVVEVVVEAAALDNRNFIRVMVGNESYLAYCEATAGHLGIEKTYERVAEEYYWPGVWHDAYQFVQECDACQRYKTDQMAPRGLMGGQVIERPWAVVASDLMEFPQSKG